MEKIQGNIAANDHPHGLSTGNERSGLLAWGFAAFCAALITAAPASVSAAPPEMVLHSFSGYPSDGSAPLAGLIGDSAGNLYGTTNVGGSSYRFGGGCGTVFELSPPTASGGTWAERVLYSFTGGNDGGYPQAGPKLPRLIRSHPRWRWPHADRCADTSEQVRRVGQVILIGLNDDSFLLSESGKIRR
jgi:hypothetical protein